MTGKSELRTSTMTAIVRVLAAAVFLVGSVHAAKPVVYPAKGQSLQQQQQGAMDTFYRAYGACMEGRGYTVK